MKRSIKIIILAVLLLTVSTGVSFLFIKNLRLQKLANECENYREIQHFKKPIPIEWEARFDGCLVSCWGAAFTKVPSDLKYPRFSGYVPDNGEPIAEEFRKEGQILKIYGKWKEISDSYGSVFNRMCVPVIDIEKIEIVKYTL